MAAGQNMIHKALFNFEYGSTWSADKCNNLIEDIFETHIITEIQKSVTRIVPEEMIIEFAKLEIDIGKIAENEIPGNLGERIGKSLEEALAIRLKTNKGNTSEELPVKSQLYLIEYLETFLLKGYLPFGLDKKVTIDDLVTKTFQEKRFRDILKKYSNYDTVLKRIAYHLKTETYDLILRTLAFENHPWIFEYRECIVRAKKQGNIHQLNDNLFVRTLHFFILKYVLNDTGQSFLRKSFSDFILGNMKPYLGAHWQKFIAIAEKCALKETISAFIKEKAPESRKEKLRIQPENKDQAFTLDQIITMLNSSGKNTKIAAQHWIKENVLRIINDRKQRKLMIHGLNKAGADFLLNMFYPETGHTLLNLLKSFTDNVLQAKDDPFFKGSQSAYIHVIVNSIHYLCQNDMAKLTLEEFVLFMVYSAGVDKSAIMKSNMFRDFIDSDHRMSYSSMLSFIKDESEYPAIANIQKVFSDNRLSTPSNDPYEDIYPLQEFVAISKRKIITYYLNHGMLPDKHLDLSRQDVLILFNSLLQQKDGFLAGLLRNHHDPENLKARLDKLISEQTIANLEEYLNRFFQKECQIFNKIRTVWAQNLEPEKHQKLDTPEFRIPILITALAATKGGALPKDFIFSVIGRLKTEADNTFEISVETWQDLWDHELREMIPSETNPTPKNILRDELEKWWNGPIENSAGFDLKPAIHPTNPQNIIDGYYSSLLFYAHHGFFPWWANSISFSEIISGLNKSYESNNDVFETLFQRLGNDENTLEMLIGKIPETIVKEFDQAFSVSARWRENWERAKKRTLNIDTNSKTNDIEREIYFSDDKEILDKRWKPNEEITNQIQAYLMLAPYFYLHQLNPPQWRKMVYEFSTGYYGPHATKINRQFHRDFLRHLKQEFSHVNWMDTLTNVDRLIHAEKADSTPFPEALRQLLPIEREHNFNRNMDTMINDDEPGIEVLVHNAGLILFWPFLTRLFEMLALVKNGAFINWECKNRAVYILQHLSCNQVNFPEYTLVLNKLLAGIPSQEHLVPVDSLTEEEQESTKSLLGGLIHNWEKVKNSTPEGIQETFIQRDGIIKFHEDKITLKVEKKGVDVLMDSIPWNISLIKLSWMKKPIYVDWN
ncbi:contractile injection system tape measure protein [Saccharicrinis sp. GN24d3]|uniref:contractile injection system tape measure protein n=1 Tax=Saccharicrinis sp. GN24d3 TaxID=3458416 RepID=UPI0040351E09